ncbi:sugar kinase [Microbulbifer sp. 2304DJ12-6]|uniref:sugar kinase n=1 Tax=Microbulbifer sp. 2304DJ12-6 TaxID=3233340 RepID=UPI0039AFCA3F
MKKKLAVLGECMLEINLGDNDLSITNNSLDANLFFGGDTLNTALYLSRLGFPVDYVTAVGDDHLSDWMLQQWRNEGIGCNLILRETGATPGLYLIETGPQGERTFLYWRDNSPARRLFDNPSNTKVLFARLMEFKAIYLSGISLGIYSPSTRKCLFEFLVEFRAAGGMVIFDSNYRPTLWGSDLLARQTYLQMYRLTDIALPTLEDEQALFGDADETAVLDRLKNLGIREIVLKKGGDGCVVKTDKHSEFIAANEVVPVDTTAAGDSFNAGYLAHRLSGRPVTNAAKSGHNLAALVIQHRGAIIPRAVMRLS